MESRSDLVAELRLSLHREPGTACTESWWCPKRVRGQPGSRPDAALQPGDQAAADPSCPPGAVPLACDRRIDRSRKEIEGLCIISRSACGQGVRVWNRSIRERR